MLEYSIKKNREEIIDNTKIVLRNRIKYFDSKIIKNESY